MTQPTRRSDRFRALIVGGGVAALEAALALRERAGDAVETTVLAPNRDFVDRPMSVREPFARSGAARFPLGPLLPEAGVAGVAEPFEPVIHGVLLGPSTPVSLRARLVGGQPISSEASDTPLWDAADKIHAPYLTRALAVQAQPLPPLASLARV